MAIKRLNYFKYQFLQEDDFADEQGYHLAMRRRHNMNYHTWGRVAGLEVSFVIGEKKVTVSPGMAVDRLGREIIIESNYEVDLLSYAGQALFLLLAYNEAATDTVVLGGVSGNTRITESFRTRLASAASAPTWDTGLELILAKITVHAAPPSGDGAIATVDWSERREAGAKIGESSFPGLKLMVPGHSLLEWPELLGVSVGVAGSGRQGLDVESSQTTFSGNVSISQNLAIAGDLTVRGIVNKTDELSIKDNIIRVNAYAPPTPTPLSVNAGLEAYRGGTAPNAQLIWDETNDRWKLGVVGALNDVLYGPNMKADVNGNVGIGTTSPDGVLHVVRTNGAGSLQLLKLGNVNQPTREWTIDVDSAANLTVGNEGAGTALAALFLKSDGYVGVGTVSPSAKLHVVGGAIMPALGNSDTAGIQFPANPGVGSGDAAFIRYFLESGTETTKLLIGCSNDADDRIGFQQFGAERLTIYNGNVGIGTVSPSAKLHVVGGAIMPALGNSDTAGIQFPANPGAGTGDAAFIRYFLESGSETTKLLISCGNDADDRIGFQQFGAERLTIYNGNVGIGTTSPAAKLDVNGSLNVAGTISCTQARVTHVHNQAPGPLPGAGLSGTFTSGGGVLLVIAHGSGWSSTGAKKIGMQINVDGMMMGSASVFTNEASSHKSFVGTSIVITSIGAGTHTLSLYRLNLDTSTDGNDYFDVTVVELPFR